LFLCKVVCSTDKKEAAGWLFVVPSPTEVIRIIGKPEMTTLGKTVSVLVWNVQKGQDKSFAKSFLELASGKEIMLLQEVHLHGARTGMEETLLSGGLS
jgi:hypothetical protein